jgi:uncharacterized membrane protein
MTEFLIAIASFFAAHMIPAYPPLRQRLIAVLGRTPYLVIYGTLSIVLLGWVILAAQRAQSPMLWDAALWQWQVPALLMPFALWFIFAGLFEPNPLSISIRTADAGQRLPPITSVTRHPVLVGFLLWALAHMPPNGDLVALLLFGFMALLAAGGCVLVDRRKQRHFGYSEWRRLARDTSIIPFLAPICRPVRVRWSRAMTLAAIASAATNAALLLGGHAALFGVSPRPPEGLPLF